MRERELSTRCKVPGLLQLVLLPVVQALGLGLEPLVDLFGGTQLLVDIPSLIDQIQHDLVLHRFAELVGVDVAAKYFQAGLLVLLQQRRAGEADEHRVRHHRRHHLVQLAALRAVALVHEHEYFAHRRAGLALQVGDELVEVIHVAPAELVHQRTQQARCGLAELVHQVVPAAGAIDLLARIVEHPLDLLVQLIAIGDHHHAGMWVVLQQPLGQQHHHDALAAALGVPDDAALALVGVPLRGLDAEILVHSRHLLDAAVEQHEIVHQLDQPILAAHLQQVLVQLVAAVVGLVFLPLQEELLRCIDGAVLQTFRVIAGKHELHRAEKPLVERRLLVGQQLADTIANADPTVLQLDDRDGDAIDVQHQIRPSLKAASERDLLGDGEIIGFGIGPVDQVHRFMVASHLRLYRYAIAEQLIDGLIVFVQGAAGVVRFGVQLVQRHADLCWGAAAPGQPVAQQAVLDLAIVVAVTPVAEPVILQLVPEQRHYAVLGDPFRLADVIHSLPLYSSWIPRRQPPVFSC